MNLDKGASCTMRLKVIPGSSRNQIALGEEGTLKVKVTSPPVEGKANEAVRRILAKALGLPKGRIALLSGAHSRTKTIRIEGCSLEDATRILSRASDRRA
jgi:uncharacterized protein (TIGR00251 family)